MYLFYLKTVHENNLKLYLDIDGVLLHKNQKEPKNLAYFINFILQYFDCYWLTTHCRQGSNQAIQYLSNFYSDKIIEKLQFVKVNNWTTLKTEGIDFSTDFVWLEDYPLEAEKIVLRKYKRQDSLILVNLNNPSELLRVLKILDRLRIA